MTEKRRDPRDRPLKSDKRVSLAPLDFEQALGGILRAGPHPAKDDEPEQAEGIEKAPPKRRRKPVRDLDGD